MSICKYYSSLIVDVVHHHVRYFCLLVMFALCNRADHYIFILWFLLLLLSFFPRLISAAADWMSTILPHMVWP